MEITLKMNEHRGIDGSIMIYTKHDLKMQMLVYAQLVNCHAAMLFHDQRFKANTVEFAGNRLSEIINELVKFPNSTSLFSSHFDSNAIEKLIMIKVALLTFRQRKIRFHEAEHKDNGSHWATGTQYYLTDPAKNLKKFLRMYVDDQHSLCQFHDEYKVYQGDGMYFIIDDYGHRTGSLEDHEEYERARQTIQNQGRTEKVNQTCGADEQTKEQV